MHEMHRSYTGKIKDCDRPVTGRSGPVEKVRPGGPVRSEKVRPVPTLIQFERLNDELVNIQFINVINSYTNGMNI
jgi:hypothetical protein